MKTQRRTNYDNPRPTKKLKRTKNNESDGVDDKDSSAQRLKPAQQQIIMQQKKQRKQKSKKNEEKQNNDDINNTKVTTTEPTSSILTASFDNLDGHILDILFSFLTPKALYALVFCNKSFQKYLTHAHVIRSTIFFCGRPGRTIKEIVTSLQEEMILVPSPLRLLRLVNGSHCERGSNCYHINKRGRAAKKVHFVRPQFGLFICWACINKAEGGVKAALTMAVDGTHPIVKQPNMAHQYYSCEYFVLKQPYYDLTGERASAKLTMTEYLECEKEYKKQQQQQTKNKKDNHNKKKDLDTIVNEHVKDVVNNHPWSTKSNEIIEIYNQSLRDCAVRKEQTEAQRVEKRANKTKLKIQKLQKHLHFIEGLINPEWREIFTSRNILSHEEIHNSNGGRSSCVKFKSCYVSHLMGDVVSAPSSCTRAKCNEIATRINTDIGLLHEAGILDFSFLQTSNNTNDNVNETKEEEKEGARLLESALLAYVTPRYTRQDLLFSPGLFDSGILEKFQSPETYLKGLATLLKPRLPFSRELLLQFAGQGMEKYHVIMEAFALWVKDQPDIVSFVEANAMAIDNVLNLARASWRHCCDKYYDEEKEQEETQTRNYLVFLFTKSTEIFKKILPKSIQYQEYIMELMLHLDETGPAWLGGSLVGFLCGRLFWTWRETPRLLLIEDYREIRVRLFDVWCRYRNTLEEPEHIYVEWDY